MEEWEKELTESRRLHNEEIAEIRAIMNNMAKKMEQSREESDKEMARLRELQEENAKGFAELRELQKRNEEESEKEWTELRKQLGGISDRNGKVAEEFFYNSLNEIKTLGGIHFDSVEKNMHNTIRLKNGEWLKGQYDITLINETSLGIVEVKYSVEKDDVEKLANKQVHDFKMLFPMYADCKYYLAVAGLNFDRQAEEAAKKHGIAILKIKGDVLEINDNKMKVY